MTRLSWGALSDRYYESGIDNGVLYVSSQPGVAWSGLISIQESPTGGEPRSYYFDGVKYLLLAGAEEFEATIQAFGSPSEFKACEGISTVHLGLFAHQQPRVPFGLSYRTRIGNAVRGDKVGYKIHLVYGALAAPSNRDNKSTSDSTDPATYSWHITTLPPAVTGLKRTAHFTVDSRYADSGALSDLNDLLYGTDSSDPELPTPDELIAIFA